MMAPTLVLEDGRPRLALGSAGSVRLAGAIVQVIDAVLGRGSRSTRRSTRPRIHVEGDGLHLEGGTDGASPREGWERSSAGRAATSSSAASRPSSAAPTAPSRRPATRAAAATGSSSLELGDPRRARRRTRPTLVELAAAVSGEPEGWLITTDGWRSVSDERRFLTCAPLPARGRLRRRGRRRDRRPALARARHAPGQPARRRSRPDGRRDHRRRGIGRALLDQSVAWAREAGVRKLELHVFPWNEPAIRLYETFGFEREGYRQGTTSATARRSTRS